MATKKEIEEHLKIALDEIGQIKPWYSRKYGTWIFEHPSYPIGCEGDSPEDVIQKYPLYIEEFIEQRLNNNLAPFVEKKTKGHGGKRSGAGRPVGSKKESKIRIYLPDDLAHWFKQHPEAIPQVRQLMQKRKIA